MAMNKDEVSHAIETALLPAFQLADYATIALALRYTNKTAATIENMPIARSLIESVGLPGALVISTAIVGGIAIFLNQTRSKNEDNHILTNTYRGWNMIHAYVCLNNLANIAIQNL
jgi:hypothetical protein